MVLDVFLSRPSSGKKHSGAPPRVVLSRPGESLKNVLYLHGFASSPAGRKIELLRSLLEPRGLRVVAPDLNIPSFQKLEFKAMARVAFWEAKKHMPAVVVGSSLGAVVALELARTAPIPAAVLIAPALGFGQRWTENLPEGDLVPMFHFGESRVVPIHRRFFEHIARVDVETDPPRIPTVVVMGTADESVPYAGVAAVWKRWEASGHLPAGSRLVAIAGGDHGLVAHVGRIAEEIASAAGVPATAR
ncbi:MAG: YqiA/YcfP family alpha/beta fold hydrolase [Acidobacteriota bacterium]